MGSSRKVKIRYIRKEKDRSPSKKKRRYRRCGEIVYFAPIHANMLRRLLIFPEGTHHLGMLFEKVHENVLWR